MKQIILTAAVIAMALLSCEKDDDNDNNAILYGSKIAVGNGTVRSFLANAADPAKMELGLVMEASALDGLPQHEANFVIDLPDKAQQVTPYKHISMDWGPAGHEPQGVYDKPHFDIHYFMISENEQNAISATSPEMQKLPDSNFLPPLYVPEQGGLDKMGKHWVDILSPELDPVNPVPFTTTMIYGTYNAKVVFLEPMVTRDFLLSKPDTTMNIRQPLSFAVSSNYPEKYKIRFDQASGKIFVSFLDFKFRNKQ